MAIKYLLGLRCYLLKAWSSATNKCFLEKAKLLGISLDLVMLYQKNYRRQAVLLVLYTENLSKTKRKFRLLFCRYQLAMQSVAFSFPS